MYKKSFGVLLAIAMVFMLAACGGDEEKRVFELNQNGVEMTMTYYHKGDKVTKQTTNNVLSYAALGVSTKEQAQEILDPLADMFKGVEGVKHKIDYTDTEIKETIEIDYEKVDMSEVAGLPGMMLDGDVDSGISMKQSAEMLLDQGFTEK